MAAESLEYKTSEHNGAKNNRTSYQLVMLINGLVPASAGSREAGVEIEHTRII